MDSIDILNIRLANQRLFGNSVCEPEDIVEYMGAMQSQAYEMAKWGIGLRLPGATNRSVEEAVNSGKIIRTHILRPTWHFITAKDIHWMIELSSPRIKPAFINYAKMNGVDEASVVDTARKLAGVIEKYGHSTKPEIESYMDKEGLNTEKLDMSYVLSWAELDGIICSGVVRGSKQTYALLDERAPIKMSLCKEESIEQLTRRFFTSHGPATLQDFLWWSGLLATDARLGLELIKDDFVSEKINGQVYWMKNDLQIPSIADDHPLLLPAFDEFVVSYKDRTAMVKDEHWKPISKHGIFSPTIHLNGKMIGYWRKVKKKNKIEAELTFFEKTTKRIQNLFNSQIKEINRFEGFV